MKLLFDENLSDRLVVLLQQEFPGSAHVKALGLKQATDLAIWHAASVNGFLLATKDEDFVRLSMALGHPPKVVFISLGNCTVGRVESLLRLRRQAIEHFSQDEEESFLVLS